MDKYVLLDGNSGEYRESRNAHLPQGYLLESNKGSPRVFWGSVFQAEPDLPLR